MAETSPEDLLCLSAQIVSAHVTRNAVAPEALSALIRDVHAALAGVGQAPAPVPDAPQPAVPIRRSIQPDHLVCLEDGARVTMLKRYIATRFGLTPDQYRAKWGLPRDYPMTAPDYARRRSMLAKEFGLGRIRGAKSEAPAGLVEPKPEPAAEASREPPLARKKAPRTKPATGRPIATATAKKRGRPPSEP